MTQKLSGKSNIPVYGKSIGEIFYSTSSKTPPGAYPLWQGALISACDVILPDFWAEIQAMQVAGTIRAVTQATWDSEITTYGQTGAFVIDTANKTVRLPKVTSFIQSLGDLSLLGTPVGAGLPNITGDTSAAAVGNNGFVFGSSGVTTGFSGHGGALSVTDGGYNAATYGTANARRGTLNIDASLSNPIYGNSTTVQPPAVRFPLYIQVYNCPVTASQAITDQLFQSLNTKAEISDVATISLTNVTADGKALSVGWGMPDVANGESKTINTLYQASSNGLLALAAATGGGAQLVVYSDSGGATVVYASYIPAATGTTPRVICPVSSGLYYKGVLGATLIFYPCVGG